MLTFSTVNASDANAINKIVSGLDPYSDFNFVSLYSWSLHSQTKFCISDGCLFLIIPDYITQKPLYTFICDSDYSQNLQKYTDWLSRESLPLRFQLLPELVIKGVLPFLEENGTNYALCPEAESFDYIIDTNELGLLKGKKYEDLRYKISVFDRKWNDTISNCDFDPSSKSDQLKALDLARKWAKHKKTPHNAYEDEIDAFNRFLQISHSDPKIFFKAFCDNDEIIALASYEVVSETYAVGHFLKFNYSYPGIYSKLVKEVCADLVSKEIPFLNIEQDLGIEGLRKAKLRLRPVSYLKKYALTIRDQ